MARSWRVRGGSAVRRLVSREVQRLRERGWSALVRAVRLTGAAVAAYVAAEWLGLNDPPPLIAALTALIVVQVTLTGTVISGVQRVLSVLAGVVLALIFAGVVGLHWWSLGALIAASIVVGQLLRLGPQLVEVPISAMLVLGVGLAGGAESVAAGRAAETLIGTLVGVLVNLLVPPPVQNRNAGAAIQKLAEEIAVLLGRAAADVPAGLSVDLTNRWLDDARRLNRHVPRVDRALAEVEESRQLNLRALTSPDEGVGLRDGLDALEHCSVTVRSLFRSLHEAARAEALTTAAGEDEQHLDQLRWTLAALFSELATAVRAFGRLLESEVDGHEPLTEESELTKALRTLRATRTQAADLLLADPRQHPSVWALTSAVAIAVDRLLGELDLAEHARVRDELHRAARRRRAAGALQRLRHPGTAPSGPTSDSVPSG